jgi:hypothetical protein
MTTNGIYTLEELLAQNFTPASEFGFDNIAKSIQARLDYLNGANANMMGQLVEQTTDVRRVWGSETENTMVEVTDDLGSANSRVVKPGVEVDFPLRKFSVKTGWTKEWLRRATPADFAKKFLAAEVGYQNRMLKEMQFAIFNDDNYTYKDWLIDNTSLAVKAFLNADSAAIPDAPDGTTFDGTTHSHYNGTASFAYTDVDALITDVAEHGQGNLALFVYAGDVAGLVGLASTKFVALTHAALAIPGRTSGTVTTDDPATEDRTNRLAGYWDGVPVFVKPWVIDNYIVCANIGASDKPLVNRTDKIVGNRGLILDNESGLHPVTAQDMVAFYGFAAWNRAGLAVLDTANHTTYTEPTLLR